MEYQRASDFHQKLRRFCSRNGLTAKQQLYLESLVKLRLEELRCPACGTLDGCGCASPGWPAYGVKKSYAQLESDNKLLHDQIASLSKVKTKEELITSSMFAPPAWAKDLYE